MYLKIPVKNIGHVVQNFRSHIATLVNITTKGRYHVKKISLKKKLIFLKFIP